MEIGGDDDGSSPSRKRLPPFPRAIFVSLEVPFASLHDVARSLDRLVVAREHDIHLVRNAENVFHAVAEFPDGSTGKPVDQLTLCPVEGVTAHQNPVLFIEKPDAPRRVAGIMTYLKFGGIFFGEGHSTSTYLETPVSQVQLVAARDGTGHERGQHSVFPSAPRCIRLGGDLEISYPRHGT